MFLERPLGEFKTIRVEPKMKLMTQPFDNQVHGT